MDGRARRQAPWPVGTARRPTCPRPGGNARAFTLLELMIVLAIVGLLAALALPGYRDLRLRAGRADGRAGLLQVAAEQERFHSAHGRYAAFARPFGDPPLATRSSEEGRYELSVAPCAGTSIEQCFVASAVPLGAQVEDACGTLTLDAVGRRGAGGGSVEDCWAR